MPVVQIENSIKVEPDHVYVIAPDQELTIREGVVHTNKPTAPRGHRHPVDSFFRSLAEDQGERAIAIILSGTGTNGSLGLRFIKAEGGIALAQDPESAAFPGHAAERDRHRHRRPGPAAGEDAGGAAQPRPPSLRAAAGRDAGRGGTPEDQLHAAADARCARSTQAGLQQLPEADAAAPHPPPHGPAPDRQPAATTSSGCATTRTRSRRWRPI